MPCREPGPGDRRRRSGQHLADHAVQPGPRCRAQADRMGAYAPALVVAAIVAVAFLQSRPQTEALNNDEDGIAFPGAMGIAILRRRLYDLDVIVSKTVVYVALAAFIGLVYIALVVGIGAVIANATRPASGCRSCRPRWSRWRFSRSARGCSGWRTVWSTGSGPRPMGPCPRSRTSWRRLPGRAAKACHAGAGAQGRP